MTTADYREATVKLNLFSYEMINYRIKAKTCDIDDICFIMDKVSIEASKVVRSTFNMIDSLKRVKMRKCQPSFEKGGVFVGMSNNNQAI